MSRFDQLVREQLKTMEKLLYLNSEIERCQQLEQELIELQSKTELQSISEEIQSMKVELKQIQSTFEQQTDEVISTYKQGQENSISTVL